MNEASLCRHRVAPVELAAQGRAAQVMLIQKP